MKLNVKKPREFLTSLLASKGVEKDAFETFKKSFLEYKQSLSTQANQSEPNIVANSLKPFIDKLSYNSEPYTQKGQSGIDLAILEGGQPAVIIEAKKPKSSDMIQSHNANTKAFHEAVLYFLRERANGNNSIYHIIITDFDNWFIFDAKDFDYLFWQDNYFKKLFNSFESPTLLGNKTSDFYASLEKEIPKLKEDLITPLSLDCAYFNISEKHSETQLIAIYKLLSKDCLLKQLNPNDANTLNKDFYSELLYILGLEESTEKGKKVIGRASSPQQGTLYENIASKLEQYNQPNNLENVIKLTIIWINRILFLKLLESQIIKWNSNLDYNFLNPKKITQYDQIETLFFEVLAKPVNQRNAKEFNHIPYLNSSLFQVHPDEEALLKISNLNDDLEIAYHPKTVLKDQQNKRCKGTASTLPYLLSFLDAYDFSNDSNNELVESSKTLINSSVLGLIFEKINGYKDGSFYTPSFVTMHMASKTLENTIIEKFNHVSGWTCKSLKDIHNKIEDISAANNIINSIKVCDPAVGSGHFLVSTLNEILRIKSYLGILVDENGKRIRDYTFHIENDELIIRDDEGQIFEYHRNSKEKATIQKTLFQEKQIIIENCLFGVDINPNSVNICRLRLWIELLKNAYYKDNGELDTLPNIDINIKCGNSLISRFSPKDKLSTSNIKNEIKEYKNKVLDYKENKGEKHSVLQAIKNIKEGFQKQLQSSHTVSKKLEKELIIFVSKFSLNELPKDLKFRAVELNILSQQTDLFSSKIDKVKLKQAKLSLEKAWLKVQEIEQGKIYENAFEWRFEFPEVLDKKGNFVGFDIVIGNPPYIKEDTNKSAFDGLQDHPCYQGKTDLWHLFAGLALDITREQGTISFIAKNQWLESQSASKMREVIYKDSKIQSIIDFGTNMVFDEAAQQTMIFFLEKHAANKNHEMKYIKFSEKLNNKELAELLTAKNLPGSIKQLSKSLKAPYDADANLTFSDAQSESILAKIEHAKMERFIFDGKKEITQGIIGGPDKAFTIKKSELSNFSETEKTFIKMLHTHTESWYTPPTDKYIIYLSSKNFTNRKIGNFPNIYNHFKQSKDMLMAKKENYKTPNKPYYFLHRERDEKFFIGGERLVWAKRTEGAKFTITSDPLYGTANLFFAKTDRANLKYLTALLNSNIMLFFMHHKLKHTGDLLQIDKNQFLKLPLYIPSDYDIDKICAWVDEIVNLKKNNQDFNHLEGKLNQFFYQLFNLEDNEIKMIETFLAHLEK